MSLTSHLKDSRSPIHQFLYEQFPAVKEVARDARAAVKEVEAIRPKAKVPYGTLGMALEYRIRYYFAVTPPKGAISGAQQAFTSKLRRAYEGPFTRSLNTLAAELQPAGKRLSRDDEDRLLRHCVVLALFEQGYRSTLTAEHRLLALKSVSLDALLGIAPRIWIDDLRAQSWRFYDCSNEQLTRPVFLNPTFDGSHHVGGADADLILDGQLVDIKSTVSSDLHKLSMWLRQLVGYVLLDYTDKYRIQAIGFYFARHGVHVSWPLPELLATMMGSDAPSIKQLRAKFKRFVERL